MNWKRVCRNADRLLFRQLASDPHTQQGGVIMSQATINGVMNGVNIDRLGGMIQIVQQNPTLATFHFRAKNKWITGGHNRSTIQSFYGAGQEFMRKNAFVLDSDEPPALLGTDQGPNPMSLCCTPLPQVSQPRSSTMQRHEAFISSRWNRHWKEILTYKDFSGCRTRSGEGTRRSVSILRSSPTRLLNSWTS